MDSRTVDMLGNAMIYISKHCKGAVGKTKMIKLLFFIEEEKVRTSAFPMFDVPFEAWQRGPVQPDVYNDLVSEEHTLFGQFIDVTDENGKTAISAKKDFDDDEFSDFDISVMDSVLKKYGDKTAEELVDISHKPDALWSLTISNDLRRKFETDKLKTSDVTIDFSKLLDDKNAEFYHEMQEQRQFFKHLRA